MTATTLAPLPVGTQVTFANTAGRVLATREANGYDDSDFFAKVAFDAEDGGFVFVEVQVGSTRYGGGFIARPNVTDEAILAVYAAKRAEVIESLRQDRAARDAATVEVGKDVVIVNPVTRGKNKTAAGATGTVTRKVINGYADPYGKSEHKFYRVAVILDEEGDARTVWLDEDRVRVLGHEDEDLPYQGNTVEYLVLQAWPLAQAPR